VQTAKAKGALAAKERMEHKRIEDFVGAARAGAALPVTFTFFTAVMAIFETGRSLMFA